jgi:hypothetical protein
MTALPRWELRRKEILAARHMQQELKPGWYASSTALGIQMGPLASEEEARSLFRLSPEARARQRLTHGTDFPYPHDMLIWEETTR